VATKAPPVRCPGCQRPQSRRGPDAIYWCNHCRCQFDDTPDEGGDFSDRDPAWRLEREERTPSRRARR
jgi:hypothetical protein